MHPLANPVLIAVALIVAVLAVTDTAYKTYFDGAQFVHFLLGPAVVGLAVPLAREWGNVRRLAVPIAGALVVGSVVALVQRGRTRQAAGCVARDAAVARAEVGDRADRDGHRARSWAGCPRSRRCSR